MLEELSAEGGWRALARGITDSDGRVRDLLRADEPLQARTYRLVFDTAAYFRASEAGTFYPEVAVIFVVKDPAEHYHVPLLLSPFGYSTYRGS